MPAIGIDPGLNGSIVALSEDRSLIAIRRAEEWVKDRQYNEKAMLAVLQEIVDQAGVTGPLLIVIERQWPRDHDGRRSAFTLGEGYGLWRGVLTHFSKAVVFKVSPQRWQAVMHKGAPGKDSKARSIHVASQMTPEVPVTSADDADADCIALYGLHLMGEL